MINIFLYKGFIICLKNKKDYFTSCLSKIHEVKIDEKDEFDNSNYVALLFSFNSKESMEKIFEILVRSDGILSFRALEMNQDTYVRIFIYYSFNDEGLRLTKIDKSLLTQDEYIKNTNPFCDFIKKIIY